MRSIFRVCFIVFFIPFQFCSQIVNIENRRIYDDTLGWSGAVDANFSALQNKDLLLSGSFRPRVQYKTKRNYFLFLTDWTYSKGADRVFANAGMSHFRYAFRLQSKKSSKKSPWKLECYTQIQYNQLLDQRMRTLVGTGIRCKLLDKKGYRIYTGSSFFYEYEEILSAPVFNRDFRWSNYLSWYFNPLPTFSFTGVTYYQPLFKDFKDFRWMGQYTLSFQVMRRVDLRFEFNTFYDSRPPINIEEWVFSSSAGVRVRLGE